MKQIQNVLTATALAAGMIALGASAVQAEKITLRIGAGHPVGPTVYVNVVDAYFVPEVKRRVAEETDHTIEFVEAYGGTIAGVAETLEAVQAGLLDIGAYCFCFEPAKLFFTTSPITRRSGRRIHWKRSRSSAKSMIVCQLCRPCLKTITARRFWA